MRVASLNIEGTDSAEEPQTDVLGTPKRGPATSWTVDNTP